VRRFLTIGFVVAVLATLSANIGTAWPSPHRARAIELRSTATALAGVVNVRTLPRIKAIRHSPVSFPLRRGPGSSSGAVSAAVEPPATPLTTITHGTPLPSALASGNNPFQLTPPDMGLAVGSGKEVEMINVVGRIWTGTTAGSVFGLGSFFLAPSDSLSDPWVLFDTGSGRFFAGIFDISIGGEIMAASQTSDPSGSWWIYKIPYQGVSGGGCPDQGKGGVDDDVVALGFNEFSAAGCAGGGGSFLGAGIEIFNKAQMMAGALLHYSFTNPLSQYFSLVPAQALSATTTENFAALNSGTGTKLHRVTSVGVPGVGAGPVLTTQPDLAVPSYSNPPKAAQNGTTKTVDTGDDRVQHVAWRTNALVLSATVGCKPSGDTTTRSCARIIEVNTTSNTLTKSATLSKNGHYYYYPAASITSANNVVVTFAHSSSTIFPALMASAGAIGGAFAAPITAKAGTAANTTGRYGDYFAVAIDTVNPANAWIAGEIGGTSGSAFKWGTAVVPVTIT
jgi:hypothetical protein